LFYFHSCLYTKLHDLVLLGVVPTCMGVLQNTWRCIFRCNTNILLKFIELQNYKYTTNQSIKSVVQLHQNSSTHTINQRSNRRNFKCTKNGAPLLLKLGGFTEFINIGSSFKDLIIMGSSKVKVIFIILINGSQDFLFWKIKYQKKGKTEISYPPICISLIAYPHFVSLETCITRQDYLQLIFSHEAKPCGGRIEVTLPFGNVPLFLEILLNQSYLTMNKFK
jgi:hypothetical protein